MLRSHYFIGTFSTNNEEQGQIERRQAWDCRLLTNFDGSLIISAYTAGILQCNPIQSAISQNLIGQIFATELDYIVKCPQ